MKLCNLEILFSGIKITLFRTVPLQSLTIYLICMHLATLLLFIVANLLSCSWCIMMSDYDPLALVVGIYLNIMLNITPEKRAGTCHHRNHLSIRRAVACWDSPLLSASGQYKTTKSAEMRIMKMLTWLPWLPPTHSILEKWACPAAVDRITDAGLQALQNSSSSSLPTWTKVKWQACRIWFAPYPNKYVLKPLTVFWNLLISLQFWGVTAWTRVLIFSWLCQTVRWLPNWMGILPQLWRQARKKDLWMTVVIAPFVVSHTSDGRQNFVLL